MARSPRFRPFPERGRYSSPRISWLGMWGFSARGEGEHQTNKPPQGEHEDKGEDQTDQDILSWPAVNEVSFTVALALYTQTGGQDASNDLAQGWGGVFFFLIHDGNADSLRKPASKGAVSSFGFLLRSIPASRYNANRPSL